MQGMHWLRSLLEEVSPVVVFGLSTYFFSFEIAMVLMIGTMILTIVTSVIAGNGWPWFAMMSTFSVVMFAALSLYFDDFSFFTASDTILDGLIGILLLSSLWWRQTLLQTLFTRTFAITTQAWRILTIRWGIFLLIMAALNEIVRLQVSNEAWAYYKVGATVVLLLFGCYQFTLSSRMRIKEESNWLGLRMER